MFVCHLCLSRTFEIGKWGQYLAMNFLLSLWMTYPVFGVQIFLRQLRLISMFTVEYHIFLSFLFQFCFQTGVSRKKIAECK